ncbi:MAG: hypothetical protein IH600_03630 [Bacteroidetes bacterium]|nr:hypothetical protein [Bacteroidota bacterium]
MRFILSIIIFLTAGFLHAQNTMQPAGTRSEGTLQALRSDQFIRLLEYATHPLSEKPEAELLTLLSRDGSCGFGVIFEALRRLQSADRATADAIRGAFRPPSRQLRRTTPSGRIDIYYDTTGADAPAMLDEHGQRIVGSAHTFVDHLAEILDSVYLRFADIGYRAPSPPTGANTIPIILSELNGVWYGVVEPGLPRPNSGTVKPTYECSLQLDNDFREFPTTGLDGARVTAAHEFHHWVQLSEYGWWGDDQWIYEMTSTCMEATLYPDIRDYHQYVDQFMRSPHLAFYQWEKRGYELVLHALYLAQRFGDDCLRDVWEHMRSIEPITALRTSVAAKGAEYAQVFCQWGETIYYTGYRAGRITPQFYDHAAEFPTVRFQADLGMTGSEVEFAASVMPLASMYFRTHRGLDTVAVLVSNPDLDAASRREKSGKGFRLRVRTAGADGDWRALDNGWSYRMESDHDFCIRVLEGGAATTADRDLPFPNPFLPDGISRVYFPLPRSITVNRGTLRIFSASMDLVTAEEDLPIQVDALTGVTVSWDGRAANGAMAPSGVYFYSVHWNGGEKTGKFALIRR